MKKEYTIKQSAETVWWYEFTEPNAKGETLIIELSFCEDSDFKSSLPKLWYKNGYTDKVLKTYWVVQTYVTDSDGYSWGRYNPTIKRSDDGKRQVINFNWKFEGTEENKEKLINEVWRQFSNAKGKSATEIRKEKLKEYTEEHNIKLYTELPKGWKVTKGSVAGRYGAIPISNGEFFGSGKRQEGLLLEF